MAATMELEDNFKFSLDVHFAQRLAGNVPKIRDRTVKKLKRWIAARSVKMGGVGMEDELLRLWKGLFYCMWMCDKPVVQEELADRIAELIHCFTTPLGAMTFWDTFFLTMKREWNGIDGLRMDKYFMFVRRCLRQALIFARNSNWDESIVDQLLAVLCKVPLSTSPDTCPDGLCYHVIDIFQEELARCASPELKPEKVTKLIDPFCVLVTKTHNKTLQNILLRVFFQEIVDQSDVGLPDESEDEGINSGEEEEAEERPQPDEVEDDGEVAMATDNEEDIPKLNYDYKAIAARLFALAGEKSTNCTTRRKMYAMVKKFQDLAQGVFPDYNLKYLVDYHDPDDGHIYGDRIKCKKKTKPTRRGGNQVRERQERVKESGEDGNLGNKQRRKHRRKKKVASVTSKDSARDEGMQIGKGSNSSDANKDDRVASHSGMEVEGLEKNRKRKRRRNKKVATVKSEDYTRDEDRQLGKSSDANKDDKMASHSGAEENGSAKTTPRKHKRKQKENSRSVESEMVNEASSSSSEFAKPFNGNDGLVNGDVKCGEDGSNGTASKFSGRNSDLGKVIGMLRGDVNKTTKKSEEKMKPITNSGQTSAERAKNGKATEQNDDGGVTLSLGETGEKSPSFKHKVEDMVARKDTIEPGLGNGQKSGKTPKKRKFGVMLRSDCSDTKTTTPIATAATEGGYQKNKQPFAVFQKVGTPPAVVRRMKVRKDNGPQSEPPRKKKAIISASSEVDCDVVTPRKCVKIVLGLNQAHASQDYMKQLEESPGIPFDCSKKPTQSVLKTPSPVRIQLKSTKKKVNLINVRRSTRLRSSEKSLP